VAFSAVQLGGSDRWACLIKALAHVLNIVFQGSGQLTLIKPAGGRVP
jgi:hypothetical protein